MNLGVLVACAALTAIVMTGSVAQPAPAPAPNPAPIMPPSLPPSYVVNLMTQDGVAVFNAQWKNMDVKIVDAPPMANAGPQWKSSYDIQPHAGEMGFDDSSWPVIEAKSLADRRGGGRLFMTWYRTNLTIPAKIGDFDTTGATAVITFTIDDYAEAWVNGAMPRRAPPEPSDNPGLQHAQPRRAFGIRQAGRQIPDRDHGHQRADLAGATESGVRPRGEDRVL